MTQRHRPLTGLTAYAVTPVAEAPSSATPTAAVPQAARWAGPIGIEGELTGDGRGIAPKALRWEETAGLQSDPSLIPLRFVSEDVGYHDGAVVVGGTDVITRRSGGVIWGEGPLYVDTDEGAKAYLALKNKRQNGVSMDLDDVTFEIRIAGELYDEMEAQMAELEALFDPDNDGSAARPEDEEPEPRNEDGSVTVATIGSTDEIQYTTDARIRATTIVAVPAFDRARIEVVDEDYGTAPADHAEHAEDNDDVVISTNSARTETRPTRIEEHVHSLTASGVPVLPPRAWFEDPHLSEPTPLHVTAEGRIYGHLATWGTCHRTHTQAGQCITPPNSAQDYAQFHLGELLTAEGEFIDVGNLTMGTGHAKDGLSLRAAASHYENTGTVAGQVRAYEDAWGIAVAGAADPALSEADLRKLRACPLSGDWRRAGYSMELVAALAVPVPGYGIPRVSGHLSHGKLTSLTASGMIIRVDDDDLSSLSTDDLAYLRGMIERDRLASLTAGGAPLSSTEADLDAALALRQRVTAAERSRKVHQLAHARQRR